MKRPIKTPADLLAFVKEQDGGDFTSSQLEIFCELVKTVKKLDKPNVATRAVKDKKIQEAVAAGEAFRLVLVGKAKTKTTPKGKKKAPLRVAKAKVATSNADKGVAGKTLCLCGCGQETGYKEMADGTRRHKLFLPGHDAKLKSKVKAVGGSTLPARVLSRDSLHWCAGWHVLTRAEKTAIGVTHRKPWSASTESGNAPRSLEEWRSIK